MNAKMVLWAALLAIIGIQLFIFYDRSNKHELNYESFPVGGIVVYGLYFELSNNEWGKINLRTGIDNYDYDGFISFCGGTKFSARGESSIDVVKLEQKLIGMPIKDRIYINGNNKHSIIIPFYKKNDSGELYSYLVVDFVVDDWECLKKVIRNETVLLR